MRIIINFTLTLRVTSVSLRVTSVSLRVTSVSLRVMSVSLRVMSVKYFGASSATLFVGTRSANYHLPQMQSAPNVVMTTLLLRNTGARTRMKMNVNGHDAVPNMPTGYASQ